MRQATLCSRVIRALAPVMLLVASVITAASLTATREEPGRHKAAGEASVSLASIECPEKIIITRDFVPAKVPPCKINYTYHGPRVSIGSECKFSFSLSHHIDGRLYYWDTSGSVIDSGLDFIGRGEHGVRLFDVEEFRNGDGWNQIFLKEGMKNTVTIDLLPGYILKNGYLLNLIEKGVLGKIVLKVKKIRISWELEVNYHARAKQQSKGECTLEVGKEIEIDVRYKPGVTVKHRLNHD